MMDIILNFRPVIAVFISMVAAALIMICGDHVKANTRESITMGASIIKALCVFSMVPAVLAGKTFDIVLFQIADGIDFHLKT